MSTETGSRGEDEISSENPEYTEPYNLNGRTVLGKTTWDAIHDDGLETERRVKARNRMRDDGLTPVPVYGTADGYSTEGSGTPDRFLYLDEEDV